MRKCRCNLRSQGRRKARIRRKIFRNKRLQAKLSMLIELCPNNDRLPKRLSSRRSFNSKKRNNNYNNRVPQIFRKRQMVIQNKIRIKKSSTRQSWLICSPRAVDNKWKL